MQATDQLSDRVCYFLANDRVLDQTIAFLNSFRQFNPDLPLQLIPYDDACASIEALAGRYDFSQFDNQSVLERCDRISELFHERTLGTYRKLAIWSGSADTFLYIDTDTVVLREMSFAFDCLHHADVVVAVSNTTGGREWVWGDDIESANVLADEQIAFSANTGFVVSTKPVMDFDWIEQQAEAALSLKDHMRLDCMEQPLLNYLIVTSRSEYSSLIDLKFRGVCPDLPLEQWAGYPGATSHDFRNVCYQGFDRSHIHWAGSWKLANGNAREIPYGDIWNHYRYCVPT